MQVRWVFLGSILIALCLMPLATWAQGSDPDTWPIVYQDDFEDPSTGWDVEGTLEETEYAARAYIDGVYEIQVNDDWSTWSWIPGDRGFLDFSIDGTYEFQVQTKSNIVWSRIPGSRDFLDFSVEVDVQMLEGTGEFGFLFRYLNSFNSYSHTSHSYCFTLHTDGLYRLRIQENDSWQTLVDWTSCEDFKFGVTNHLKLIAQGEKFSFLLNERLLTKVIDATFRGGEIALAAGIVDNPNVNVRFDNLVVRADPALQEPLDQVESLYQIAHGETERRDAFLQQALRIYEDLGWKEQQARVLTAKGVNLFYQYALAGGEDPKVIECYEQALSIYQQLGHQQGEMDVLVRLGNYYKHLTQYERAIVYYEQSLAICREIRNQEGEADSLSSLGDCYRNLDEYEQAINYYELSINVYRDIADMLGEITSLESLSECYGYLGRYTEAINCFKQSKATFALLRMAFNPRVECSLYYSVGEYEMAISCYEESLAINREAGNSASEVEDLRNLGECYYSLGYYERAIAYSEQSLLIREELGYRDEDERDEAAKNLNVLGNCHRALGAYVKAIGYYSTSLNFCTSPYDWVIIVGNISQCYLFLGDNNRALVYAMVAGEHAFYGVRSTAFNNIGKCYFAGHAVEILHHSRS